MTTAATISARLVLENSAYQKGLSDASRQASQFRSNFESSMGGMSTKAVAAGNLVANALTGAFNMAIGAAENMASSFLGIIKNATLATARVDELQAVNLVLAKNGGYSIGVMQREAQEIRDNGIQASVAEQMVAEFMRANLDLAKASDIARIAQDSAVIAGIDSSEATDRITQGIVKLNPLILRNAGIVVDLQGAYEAYAKAQGVSTQELTTAEKQMIAMNAVIEQGTKIEGAYSAAMELPGKQLRSFPRYFNDVMISMGEPFQAPFAAFLGNLKSMVKFVGENVKEGGKFRPYLDKIAELAMKASDFIGNLIDTFIATGKVPLPSFLQNIVDGFKSLADFIQPIIDKAKQFIDHWGGMGGVFQLLVTNVKNLIENFKPLLVLAGGLGGVFLKALFPAIVNLAKSLAPLISEFLPPFMDLISELAMVILETLLPPMTEMIKQILPVIITLFNVLVRALMPIIQAILPPLVNLFTSLVVAIMPLIKLLAEMAIVLLSTLLPPLAELAAKIFPILVEIITAVVDAVVPLIEDIFPELVDIVVMIIDAFIPLIEAILPAVADLFLVVIKAILPIIKAILPLLVALIKLLITALMPMINAILPYLIALFEAIGNALERYVLPALETFADWIDDKVVPAIQGIIDIIEKVIDWLKSLGEAFDNIHLPDWLTPGSPTPLEMGLRGIKAALSQLPKSVAASFPLPDYGRGNQNMMSTGSMAVASGITIYNYGTVNFSGQNGNYRQSQRNNRVIR